MRKKEKLIEGNQEVSVKLLPKTENDSDEFLAKLKMLASLMDKSFETVKDDCFLLQIKNLMSRLKKVVLSDNYKIKDFLKMIQNANKLDLGEILIPPVYIEDCYDCVEKSGLYGVKISAVVDFPTGEGLLKRKIAEMKECKKLGVDGVYVMLPKCVLDKESEKDLKKMSKKLAKAVKGKVNLAFSLEGLEKKRIEAITNIIVKTKAVGITYILPSYDLMNFEDRLSFLSKYECRVPINVMGNIDNASLVTKLFKLKVNTISSPIADEIGAELVDKFGIKSVKLN